jgi:hypothetical protein
MNVSHTEVDFQRIADAYAAESNVHAGLDEIVGAPRPSARRELSRRAFGALALGAVAVTSAILVGVRSQSVVSHPPGTAASHGAPVVVGSPGATTAPPAASKGDASPQSAATSNPPAHVTPAAPPSVSSPPAGASSAGWAGYSTVQTGDDSSPDGEVEAFKTAPATPGAVNRISVYLTVNNKAPTVLVGLYADDHGKPGALLASGSITSPTIADWNTAAIPATNLAATSYWIAISGQGGVVTYRTSQWGHGTLPAETASGSHTSLPQSWTTGSYSNMDGPLSAYASRS